MLALGLGYAVPIGVVLALYGFWPGRSPPALSWLLGAGGAQCVAEESFFGGLVSHCSAVGAPFGQPLLQGLPQTFLAAWVAELPWIDAWDAYKLVGILTTVAGFLAFAALLRRWRAPHWIAVVGAFLYLSSITVLSLNGYTFTFHGYVMLPAYCWLALRSLDLFENGRRWVAVSIAAATSLLMVFTDGYSFVGGSIVIAALVTVWWIKAEPPVRARSEAAGAWFGSLLLAAGAYYLYTPRGSIDTPVGLGAFRLLGIDLITLFLPSPKLWWAQRLGIGDGLMELWGSGSNIVGNYVGVSAIALTVVATLFVQRRRFDSRSIREATAIAIAGLVALVLSFGPALKVARFETPIEPGWDLPLSETTVWLPTALVYEHLPAFSSMRATYRLFTVTRFALVLAASLGLIAVWQSRNRRFAPVLAALLVLETSPSPTREFRIRAGSYEHVAAVRNEYLPGMAALIEPGDRVLILPTINDFLASAVIPFTDGKSFNVGVGKNYVLSRSHWPDTVQAAALAYGKPAFTEAACAALADDVDVIVLTYVPLRQGGIRWPADEAAVEQLRAVAQSVAAEGAFEVSESSAGLSLRPGPGCKL
jgi:hypothetical protein